jgi:NADPH:quinone reductase
MVQANTMRVAEITEFGGPEVLRMAVRPVPTPGAGEALIRVAASGINRPDVLQRKGLYAPPPGATDIPGLEVAGVLVGGDVAAMNAAGFQMGEPVCALVAGGGYAEYCVAPIGQCLPVPAGLSLVEAASLPETAYTVWSNLFDRAGLKPGESVLIHGGSSGIGVTAIQFARAMGAGSVLVTVGSAGKAQACLALGADVAIQYKSEDFVSAVQEFTQGRGVDVILDMVAGSYVARNVQALAEDGRCAIIAVQGGTKAEVDAGLVMRRRLTLTGSTLRPRSVAFKTQVAQRLKASIWPLLSSGQVKPVIHQVFQPGQFAQSHALMESGDHVGKLVVPW